MYGTVCAANKHFSLGRKDAELENCLGRLKANGLLQGAVNNGTDWQP